MNTASDNVIGNREANLTRTHERRRHRLFPAPTPVDVLQHHDQIVDDEAHRDRAIIERLSRSNRAGTSPRTHPMMENGSARLGMTVARTSHRNTKMTMTTSTSVRAM